MPKAKGQELQLMRDEIGTVAENSMVEELTTVTRREAMLAMWFSGYTFAEIAERWDFKSPAFARAAIERALANSEVGLDKNAERQRFQASLLKHHKTAATLADDPNEEERMAWMRMDLLIIDRLSKLLGLDAPTQIVINPAADDFEKLTTILAIANGADATEEADPMAVA